MKKNLLIVAVLMFASFAFAADAVLGPHDINLGGYQQGCRSCHIPHGGSIKTNAARLTIFGTGVDDWTTGTNKLWDKNLSTDSYSTYSSDNVNPLGAILAAPTSSSDVAWHSYLCFSCHDGTIATLNLPAGQVTDLLMNNGTGDTDLTNDHPVDIDWPVANEGVGNDYELNTNVTGGIFPVGIVNIQPLPLYGGTLKLECSTCHNPHTQPIPGVDGHGNFLRSTNNTDNTSFCRACHLSKR